MISNHVTCFILFYSIDWTFFVVGFFSFFPLFSFISIRVVIGIPECFLACVTPSWNFLMDYIGVYFLWFYLWGGCCLFVFWSAGRSVLPVPPSLSVPARAVPVLHPLLRLVPVWMCSPCSRSAAQYFSGFNCSGQVKPSRRASSSLGSERWVFLIFFAFF